MFAPRTEDDVLRFLAENRGRKVRVIGRLHSWSEVIVGEDAVLDLRHLDSVQVAERDGRVWATLGAGCQISRALAELERLAGVTLPAVGLITAQSIAGAAATGTHGSGRHSLSHYIEEVRIATYDPDTGQPVVRTVRDGDELKAVRCSLGCLGVILSVGIWCRPAYMVEEEVCRYQRLEDALDAEAHSPLQQVFLVPWAWNYLAQHRRETSAARSPTAWLYRLYWLTALDIGFHLIAVSLARVFTSRFAVRLFFRRIMPWTVIRGWRVTDVSYRQLTMKHERFRHLELELFVRRESLTAFVRFVEELLRHCDGEANALSPETKHQLETAGVGDQVALLAGVYRHHFPICIRKVLPDDTLISPAAGGDLPWYTVSFITFAHPENRGGFFQFATFLTRAAARLFSARPHWGKFCPLDPEDAERLYPELPAFRRHVRQCDPEGLFANDWLAKFLSK
jgi:FAD/FMN-containing dehydrogenase